MLRHAEVLAAHGLWRLGRPENISVIASSDSEMSLLSCLHPGPGGLPCLRTMPCVTFVHRRLSTHGSCVTCSCTSEALSHRRNMQGRATSQASGPNYSLGSCSISPHHLPTRAFAHSPLSPPSNSFRELMLAPYLQCLHNNCTNGIWARP